jgi:hypothetical protein
VRRLEPPAHLDRHLDRLPQGEGSALEPLPEALALEELEHDVGAALVGADVEDGRDAGMGEGGDRPGLALELQEPFLVGGGLAEQDLDRDVAAEAGVVGAVDLPIPPAPSRSTTSYGPRQDPAATAMGRSDEKLGLLSTIDPNELNRPDFLCRSWRTG